MTSMQLEGVKLGLSVKGFEDQWGQLRAQHAVARTCKSLEKAFHGKIYAD